MKKVILATLRFLSLMPVLALAEKNRIRLPSPRMKKAPTPRWATEWGGVHFISSLMSKGNS